jgi:hypothetical protein
MNERSEIGGRWIDFTSGSEWMSMLEIKKGIKKKIKRKGGRKEGEGECHQE